MAAIEQRFRSFEHLPGSSADDLERLYLDYRGAVRAICLAVLRNRDDADDAVQQVFLSALRSLRNGTVPRDPGAWLATIARRECWARARQPAVAPLPEVMRAAGAADIAATAAELAEVWRAIADLPIRQREALLLRELRGLGYDELAALMELSHPSIRSLLTRARRTLQSRLERGAAALGGAPWLNLVARLFGDGSSPVPSAVTRTAAVGLSAVALTGGAVVAPRLAAHGPHGQRAQTSRSVTLAAVSAPSPGTGATAGWVGGAAGVHALATVASRAESAASGGWQQRGDDRGSRRASSSATDGRRDGGDGGRIDHRGGGSRGRGGEGAARSSSGSGSRDGGDSSSGSGSLSSGGGPGGSGSSGHDGGLGGGMSGESGGSSGAFEVVAPSDGPGPGGSDESVAAGPLAGGGSSPDGSGGNGSDGSESSSGPGGPGGATSGGSDSDNGS